MVKSIYSKSLIILFGITLCFSVFSHIKVAADNTPLDTPSQSSILQTFKVSDYGYDCANEKGTFATGLIPTITKSVEKITSSFDMQTFLYKRDCEDAAKAEEYLKKEVGGGALFFINRANTALLDQRPASGIDYIDQKIYALSNPGIVRAAEPELYYPGAGQALLQPIQSFWGWSFNLVLAFMVVIIIVIAFAIISNAKLPGNVTVTIQTAIPNIAMAMVLIPLSYAISGLFIDFITLGTNAAHNFVFGAGAPGREVYEARDPVLPDNPTEEEREADRGYYPDDPRINVWNMWRRLNITDALQQGATTATADSINNFAPLVLVANFLNLIFSETGDGSVAYWFAAIINLIISITMIWFGIKIFIKLLGKYVTLILMPIFSPFIFATVAIPGSGTKSLMNYLKTLGSASLFYIVTYLMFLLTLILTSAEFHAKIPDFRSGAFIPPLLGIEGLGVIQGIGNSGFSSAEFSLIGFFFTLVGLGVYFSIPGVLDQIDSSMGTKFALPAFIKTPLDGFKESWKITTRGAPALGAAVINRGLIKPARAVKGGIDTRFGIPKVITGIRNFQDTRRGLKPGETGTYQRDKADEFAKEKAAAERQRSRAVQDRSVAIERLKQNPNDAAAQKMLADSEQLIKDANDRLDTVDRQAKATGIQPGYAKEEKEPQLNATVDFNGSSTILINASQFDELVNIARRLGTPPGTSAILDLGDRGFSFNVKFEAVGFTLPETIKLEAYSPKPSTGVAGLEAGDLLVPEVIKFDSRRVEPFTTRLSSTPPRNEIAFSPSRPIPVPTGRKEDGSPVSSFGGRADIVNVVEFRVKGSYINQPQANNTKFQLPVSIVVTDTARFFIDNGDGEPMLSKARVVETERVIFKVGPYSSNPISIKIEVRG